jgi:hypothetical protein
VSAGPDARQAELAHVITVNRRRRCRRKLNTDPGANAVDSRVIIWRPLLAGRAGSPRIRAATPQTAVPGSRPSALPVAATLKRRSPRSGVTQAVADTVRHERDLAHHRLPSPAGPAHPCAATSVGSRRASRPISGRPCPRQTAFWAIHLSGPDENRPLDAVVVVGRYTKILRLVRLTGYPLRP